MQYLGTSSPIPYRHKYPEESKKKWWCKCWVCCLQPALLQQSYSKQKSTRGPCKVLLMSFSVLQPAGPSSSFSSSSPGLVCGAKVLEVCGGHAQAGAAAGITALAHHGAGTRAEMLAEAPALNAHGKLGCTWPPALQTKQKIKNLCLWLNVIWARELHIF